MLGSGACSWTFDDSAPEVPLLGTPIAPEQFVKLNVEPARDDLILTDRDGNPVYLARNGWDLGRTVEDISTNGGLNFIIANPGESVSANDITKQQNTCNTLQSQFDSAEMDDPKRDVYARELNRCNFLADAFTKVRAIHRRRVLRRLGGAVGSVVSRRSGRSARRQGTTFQASPL